MDSKMGYLDGKPVFTLTYDGEQKVCTPRNTEAYVHSERFKDVDHIFRYNLEPDEEPDVDEVYVDEGIFCFRSLFGVVFNPLVQDMEALGFRLVYKEVPTDSDWEQYVKFHTKDLKKPWRYLDGVN